MSFARRGPPPSRSYNKYPTKPDGRGPSVIARKTPVGKDPLATGEGKPSTQPRHDKESA